MAGKYITLYTLPTPAAAAEAPVLISKGELLIDRFTEKLFIRIRMKSLDEREIHAVTLYMQLFDEVGAPIDTAVEYRYNTLKVKRDQEFGENQIIPLLNTNVRSFSAFLTNVTFSDYSFWENDLPFKNIGKMQTLEEALGSETLARQFEAQYGSDCHFMPSDEKIIWYCTCGAINRSDEERCHTCRRKRTALRDVNFNTIKMNAKNRGDAEDEEENSVLNEKDKGINVRKRLFRVLMILLPVLLVSALIISTIPPFVERQRSYMRAEQLLQQQQFDDAKAEFEKLGDYRNSRLQAEKEIPYQKALVLMNAANDADVSAFSAVGLKNPTVGDDEEDIKMALFESARELFEIITPYKESEDYLNRINKENEEYIERQKEREYKYAQELLEKGAYLKAYEAFLNLGSYSQAADQTLECLYQRATAVLAFCENNNIRRIFIKISNNSKEETKISMPGAVLTELGSDTVFELKRCFVEDGVEFIYEDTPSGEGFVPICEAVQKEFEDLGAYRDSAELKIRASEAGDFTRPFYQLLKTGNLSEAVSWLNKYSDDISDSEAYLDWLIYLQTLCSEWELAVGDSTLIPFSAGQEFSKLEYFSTSITIEDSIATMHIVPKDNSYEVCLSAEFGKMQFSGNLGGSIYYGYINQIDRFVYIRYTQNGTIISSCEYNRK